MNKIVVIIVISIIIVGVIFALNNTLLDAILWYFLLAFYMLPLIISYFRNHKNIIPIGICNFFFGLTGVGWIISLIWSFKK